MMLRAFAMPERDEQGQWVIVALDDEGRVFVRATSPTIAGQRSAIAAVIGPGLAKTTVWVPDPEVHPLTRAWLDAQNASAEAAAGELIDPEVAQANFEVNHLCHRCAHDRICLVARAVSQTQSATLATVTACQQFKEAP